MTAYLPAEVIAIIADFADLATLEQARQVNKEWRSGTSIALAEHFKCLQFESRPDVEHTTLFRCLDISQHARLSKLV
jgi:hypothetical protein